MHTFSIRNIAVISISILVVGIALTLIFGTGLKEVRSGTGDNLSGFAWSETIGWISMNSLDCDANEDGQIDNANCGPLGNPISNYGVNVKSNGDMEGYAWASTTGWISFESADVVGCPSGSCQPHFDRSTGTVTGWARVLSAPAAGANAGGWDGWISLSGAGYGVTVDSATCAWSGWAWGDTVVGWVNFNGLDPNTGLPAGGTVTGSGDACRGYTCTTPAPSNASICAPAVDPSANMSYTAVSTCGPLATKCHFTCDTGYIPNASATDCRQTQCNDGINNDDAPPLAIAEDNDKDCADLGCLDSNGNCNINDDSESLPVTDPTINARPRVVNQGGNTTLEWTTGGVPEATCTFMENTVDISAAARASDANPLGGTLVRQVNVRTTYTITCGALSDFVTVEVQGYGRET